MKILIQNKILLTTDKTNRIQSNKWNSVEDCAFSSSTCLLRTKNARKALQPVFSSLNMFYSSHDNSGGKKHNACRFILLLNFEVHVLGL